MWQHNKFEEVKKGEKGKRSGESGCCKGNNRGEQQSRKRRGRIRGGKAWWPDSQPEREREMEKKRLRQRANTDRDIHRITARQAIMQIGETQNTLIKS